MGCSECNECRKRKEMEKNNCNSLKAIIDNKIPVRTESRNAYYEDNNFRIGISDKRDYNYKGEMINHRTDHFFQPKAKSNYYLNYE